jgi:hypothetical protein
MNNERLTIERKSKVYRFGLFERGKRDSVEMVGKVKKSTLPAVAFFGFWWWQQKNIGGL